MGTAMALGSPEVLGSHRWGRGWGRGRGSSLVLGDTDLRTLGRFSHLAALTVWGGSVLPCSWAAAGGMFLFFVLFWFSIGLILRCKELALCRETEREREIPHVGLGSYVKGSSMPGVDSSEHF